MSYDLIARLESAASKNRYTPLGEMWNLLDEAADALRAALVTPHPARDFLREANDALAAKDAEIERLRAELQKTLDAGAAWERAYWELKEMMD